MDFQLTDSQRALQETARKYAREVIRPKAAHYDETAEFPRDLISTGYELGLMNLAHPAEYGGLGLTHLEQVLVCEELAWGCAGVATSHDRQRPGQPAHRPRRHRGAEEAAARPFTEKPKLASFCLTEPGGRLGRGRHEHHRAARRRPLRPQRRQVLHHQRRLRGPVHGVRHAGQEQAPQGHHLLRRRGQARRASPSASTRTRWASAPATP